MLTGRRARNGIRNEFLPARRVAGGREDPVAPVVELSDQALPIPEEQPVTRTEDLIGSAN